MSQTEQDRYKKEQHEKEMRFIVNSAERTMQERLRKLLREEADEIYLALKERANPSEDVYQKVCESMEGSVEVLVNEIYKAGGP